MAGIDVSADVWMQAGTKIGRASYLLGDGVDAFCRAVGGQPFGSDDLGRGLFDGDTASKTPGFVQRRDALLQDLSAAVNVLRGMGAALGYSGYLYGEAEQSIVAGLTGRPGPAPRPPGSPGVAEDYQHARVPGGFPAASPPPDIVREALWIFEAVGFGFAWPDGGPDTVRALQQAATALEGVVDEVAGQVAGQSARVTAGSGVATDAFGSTAQDVRGLLTDVEQRCADLAAYCGASAGAIVSARRHFVASAVFVLGLMATVSALGPFMEAGLAAALKLIRLEGLALRIVLRLLYEAVIGAVFSGGLDAIDQGFRPGGFNGKELAEALGQGSLAGGLMGLAHAGLPALAGRAPSLTSLARLMETPGARGIITRFTVGGTIGTTAMATSSAVTGHGWDLEHAAETGYGMALLGARTELAGRIFGPAVRPRAENLQPADRGGVADFSVAFPSESVLWPAAAQPDSTGARGEGPAGGGPPSASKPTSVRGDPSGTWVVRSPSSVRFGASLVRGEDLGRVTALTATSTPEGSVLNLRMRPRLGGNEEYLTIALDGSPPSPITDATARAAMARHGSGPADDHLASVGFRQVKQFKGGDTVWEYSPPDGGPSLGASTSGGRLAGLWRYGHDELAAYFTARDGHPTGWDMAPDRATGDLTGLWKAGALRFGLSGPLPDRITHVEVRPGATADDLRPAPAGTTTVMSAEQARTEPLRVIDRLRELGAFPDGETIGFTWGPDRFDVTATRIEGGAGAPGGYHYEVSTSRHPDRLSFDSTSIHDLGAHRPSALIDMFGDHARLPASPSPATHVTPGGYGTFHHDTTHGTPRAEPIEPLARVRAQTDAAIADLATDPRVSEVQRAQRIGQLRQIAEEADSALGVARVPQPWVAPDQVSDDHPAIAALKTASDQILRVHTSVTRYRLEWSLSPRRGEFDVAGLDPLSTEALAGERVRLGSDFRMSVLQQAKIGALAERSYNPHGENPDFGVLLRRWLVSGVALHEDAIRMYMGNEAKTYLPVAARSSPPALVSPDRRWLLVRMDDKPLADVADLYLHEMVHTAQSSMSPHLANLARSREEFKILNAIAMIEGELAPKAVEWKMLQTLAEEDRAWDRVPVRTEHELQGFPSPLHSALVTHGEEYSPDLETLEAVRDLLGNGDVPGASWIESYHRAMFAITEKVNSSKASMDTPILYYVMKKLGFLLAPPDPGDQSGHRTAILDLAQSGRMRR